MTLRSVMLQLREDQLARLDADASRAGVSRSKLVRDAVDALLDHDIDPDIAERYARAYPTKSFGTDEWGDVDAWRDAASTGAPSREAW